MRFFTAGIAVGTAGATERGIAAGAAGATAAGREMQEQLVKLNW